MIQPNSYHSGAFVFYRNPPNGEMTMAKMDSLARQRLGRMSPYQFMSESRPSLTNNREEDAEF
jgi:hypothetical protein